MSQSIAARSKRATAILVDEAERMLDEAIAAHGAETSFTFSNSVFYLPVMLGLTGKTVENLGDLRHVLQQACKFLAPPKARKGTKDKTSRKADPAVAALLAAEAVETLRSLEKVAAWGRPEDAPVELTSPISDLQVRSWGLELAERDVPAVALLLGCAKNNAVAKELVQELRRYNMVCLLSGNVNGRSIIDQVQEEGMELGAQKLIAALGSEPTSAVHAWGFASRFGMRLGGIRPGSWTQIVDHSKRRIHGFVLLLGDVDDVTLAVAAGAKAFGFPVIMDTATGASTRAQSASKQWISVPFKGLHGKDDLQNAERLIKKCLEVRGLKPKVLGSGLTMAYSPEFEDENIGEAELAIQFGGNDARAFQLVQKGRPEELTDGRVEIIGPELSELGTGAATDLGIVVKVAGAKVQTEFEGFLERRIQPYLNLAKGVQHTGAEDAVSIRIAKSAIDNGLDLRSLGKILTTRFHEDFAALEKVEVTLTTEPKSFGEWHTKAHRIHQARRAQIAGLSDSQVDEFFVCTNCRAIAPNNVTIISPERVSPCGQCNWLDAKAGYEMKSTGVRRPIRPGKPIDAEKGIWAGLNEYARTASRGRVKELALYSIAQSPVCACADFECIVMVIPEANGVMVLAHDDTSPTPAGVNVDIFASIAAGEQVPGVEGIGKSHLLSPKFIAAEGGFKRVVWMSSILKEAMAEELKSVCIREGEPWLMEKIADERQVTSVAELVGWLKARNHPALQMQKIF
jgi:acetyl-CoA synthase